MTAPSRAILIRHFLIHRRAALRMAVLLFPIFVLLCTLSLARNPKQGLESIQNVVVIYAENRSFDNLYGNFPGANGLHHAGNLKSRQVDRDGSVLEQLPPVWNGLTAAGVSPPVTQAQTEHLPSHPFAVDDPKGFNTSMNVITRDLVHRFYQNQMQIDHGKNDRFAAYGDSGAMVMAHYDGSHLPLWTVAREFTLADNFFMGSFGSSFLNHFWLICSCTPKYPNADKSPAQKQIAIVDPDGVTLTLAATSPRSALEGPPKFVGDGSLTPDFYAVNTMQPPYQPSANHAPKGNAALADPTLATTLPPQTEATIGDLLSAHGTSWAWYSGAWQVVLEGKNSRTVPNFQFHHQPFNYFASMAPGTAERAKHLKDGGMNGVAFLKAIDSGTLESVVFYKPQGNLNEHSGYADVMSGDAHIANLISHLRKSPQWAHMLIVVTYDENGGYWDHVAPPRGDRWGPGTRIPAIILSPYAKRHFVDHTQYDTTSILRFITKRYRLPMLPGLRHRDEMLKAHGSKPLGDLTGSLDLSER